MKNLQSFDEFNKHSVLESITIEDLLKSGDASYDVPDEFKPYFKYNCMDECWCDTLPDMNIAFNYLEYDEKGYGNLCFYYRSKLHKTGPEQPWIEVVISCSKYQAIQILKKYNMELHDEVCSKIFDVYLEDQHREKNDTKRWFIEQTNMSRSFVEENNIFVSDNGLSNYEAWKNSAKLRNMDNKSGILSN